MQDPKPMTYKSKDCPDGAPGLGVSPRQFAESGDLSTHHAAPRSPRHSFFDRASDWVTSLYNGDAPSPSVQGNTGADDATPSMTHASATPSRSIRPLLDALVERHERGDSFLEYENDRQAWLTGELDDPDV